MAHPIVDLVARVESGAAESRMLQVIPVYPASAKAGLTSWEIGTYVKEALVRAGPLADPLPREWRRRLKLRGRTEAMRAIHRPETAAEPWPARDRLVFDELLRLQLILVLRRRALERVARAIRHHVSVDELSASGGLDGGATLVERFVGALPFDLTAAQRRGSRRSSATWRGRSRCTACSKETSDRERPWLRWVRCWRPSRAVIRAR